MKIDFNVPLLDYEGNLIIDPKKGKMVKTDDGKDIYQAHIITLKEIIVNSLNYCKSQDELTSMSIEEKFKRAQLSKLISDVGRENELLDLSISDLSFIKSLAEKNCDIIFITQISALLEGKNNPYLPCVEKPINEICMQDNCN